MQIYLGLMSGTSVDAIDASLVLSRPGGDHLLLHGQFPYPKALRRELLGLIHAQESSLERISALHYAVGERFADAAVKLLRAAKQKQFIKNFGDVRAIGSHGQTVFHNPDRRQTLQIGEGSIIAARTGLTTVSDFRVADTASGGEGAPLLPAYHRRLFQREAKGGIAVHNLGGISNFSYLGPGGDLFALDTGPANCLLDLAIQKRKGLSFDKEGRLARGGAVNERLLHLLLTDPAVKAFRKKTAPKSTGRELFSETLLRRALAKAPCRKLEDLLATLTEFSVLLMAEAYETLILKKGRPLRAIVFCGGGVNNKFLLERFHGRFPWLELLSLEDYGLNSQALESQAFGYFAGECLKKKPISFPSTTGVKEAVVCGKISYPPMH